MQKKFKKVILLIGDLIILYLSLYLTLFLRYLETPKAETWSLHLLPFSLTFFFWILIFYISDLYDLNWASNRYRFFRRTVRAVVIAGLLSALFFYLNPLINISPKRNLLIFLAIVFVLFLVWRRIFNWTLYSYLPKENLAFIGYNREVQELIDLFRDKPHLGYAVRLVVSSRLPRGLSGETRYTDRIVDLENNIKRLGVGTVVFAANPQQSPELRARLFSLLPLKINFVNLPRFYEAATGKVPVEQINQMWFLENLNEGNKHFFNLVKRSYDLILAIIILLATAPLWPFIGLLIKLESPGPVFFYSWRTGLKREFRLVKFRTMREDGQDVARRGYTKKDDPRVTRLGAFLRKTRIDELPQILNILLGQMSFVGPRPERPEFVDDLAQAIPFYRERLLVKPGLTGWDQVSGEYHSPTVEDSLKKLQYDLYYIKNRSLYLDASILLKTIATVLRRGGV